MPQARQLGEFNTFVGGLVTEASPLTFPENASLDEVNFVLNRDGTRRRRLGMDREEGLTPYNVVYGTTPSNYTHISTFEWKDVAGIAGKTFMVCQIHDRLYVLDRADETLKSQSYLKYSTIVSGTSGVVPCSFASINGKLVVAYGAPYVLTLSYDSATELFTAGIEVVKIRDLFGVDYPAGEKDYYSPDYINTRPDSFSTTAGIQTHMYNLRNQGWGVPRLEWEDTVSGSPIKIDPVYIYLLAYASYPSNADSVTTSVYANVDEIDKNSERFNEEASQREEPARARAASGHFVIDLINRGASRKSSYELLTNITTGPYAKANPGAAVEYVNFFTQTVDLPTDRTVGGIRLVSEFAGRVWYGGLSNEVVDGDARSPKLASYVFYSQLVEHDAQIAYCYQEGDPTDKEAPDRLDTDGGFIRLSGAYNIQKLVNIGSALIVLAENGVWAIRGSDSGTFNANNQTVEKVTEHGTLSPGSVVVVDNTVMYWSDDAIYHITQDQFGSYAAKEISINISSLYQGISDESKLLVQGVFDSYDKKIRWVYDNTASTATTKELVFDLVLAAFYQSSIGSLSTSQIPVAPVIVSPYSTDNVDLDVVVGADDVLSDLDEVIAQSTAVTGGFREVAYLTLINSEDSLSTSFTFSTYNNTNFKDWESVDGAGVDAAAYLLTGYISTGDYQRQKQVPYVYFHFLRTETGFIDSGDDLTVVGESSCKVRSQWDWANSATSGKWGKEFQAYRYKRLYMPTSAADEFDSGHSTIVTKNKLRGRGRVVSLLISTEEGKDMKLLGWGMNIGVNQDV